MTGAELRDRAAAKRAEAERIAASASTGDRAAGRLGSTALRQHGRRTDSALRRYVAAAAEVERLEAKANAHEADEARRRLIADRGPLLASNLTAARYVRDRLGWHEVVRVNRKTVTVKTPWSWTDSIPIDRVLEARS